MLLLEQVEGKENEKTQPQKLPNGSGGGGNEGEGGARVGGLTDDLLREFLTSRCVRDYIMWELQTELITSKYLEPHPIISQMQQLQRPESSVAHSSSTSASASSSSSSSSSSASASAAASAVGSKSSGSVVWPNTVSSGSLAKVT